MYGLWLRPERIKDVLLALCRVAGLGDSLPLPVRLTKLIATNRRQYEGLVGAMFGESS